MRITSITLTLVALFVCAMPTSAKETMTIGVILPLSGNQAKSGEDLRDVIRMRMEELKAKNTKYNYKIVFEDDQGEPRQTINAFWKLLNVDHIDMAMSFYATPGAALTPIANNKKIIHLGLAAVPGVAKRPYSFNVYAKSDPAAALSSDFCKAMSYRRVAMINMKNAAAIGFEKAFLQKAPYQGITVMDKEYFAPGEKDFRVAILKIRESNPDALFIESLDPEASIIRKQMKEIGYNVPITSIGFWGTFSNPDPSFFGYPYVEAIASKEFADRFSEKYHHKSVYLTGFAYDSLGMYIDVCEKFSGNGKPTTDQVAVALRAVKDYPGVMGNLTPDTDGWFETPLSLIVLTPEGRREISLQEAMKNAQSER